MDEIYSTREAAAYLGVQPVTIKFHVYVVKDLVPDKLIGNTLIFTRATLDLFKKIKRPSGRPPSDKHP